MLRNLRFAERRDFRPEHTQPVIEILTEPVGLRLRPQVAVGRRDHSHVQPPGAFRADPFQFALLEDAQQLGLALQGDFPDCDEEEVPAIGQFKAADTLFRAAPANAPRTWPKNSVSYLAIGCAKPIRIFCCGISMLFFVRKSDKVSGYA